MATNFPGAVQVAQAMLPLIRKSIEEAAADTIRLALPPDDGPTGGCFDTAGPVPW